MKKSDTTLQPRQSEPATGRRARSYHSVAIRYYGNAACPAVKQFAIQPTLSTQAPPFLETRRFLSSEAPLLPLAGCTEKTCQCRYVHYADRRERDRRHPYDPFLASAPAFAGRERRSGTPRRRFQP
jgi:hypothetical protein